MPIPDADIYKKWAPASLDETVEAARSRLPDDRNERAYIYLVMPTGDGRYVVLRWVEVEEIARAVGPAILGMTFRSLPSLPAPVEAVEQSGISKQDAGVLRDSQAGKRLVVLAGGLVVGLLTREVLGGEVLGPDPIAAIPKGPLVLGIEDGDAAAPSPAGAEPDTAKPQPDDRVFNVWVVDPDPNNEHSLPKEEPLRLRKTYDLKINVASPRKDAAAAFSPDAVAGLVGTMTQDQDFIEVLVMIETSDFLVYGYEQQLLIVPRTGPSKNSVTFSIEAKQQGPGIVTLVLVVNGEVFQRTTVTLQVGELAPGATRGIAAKSSGVTFVSGLAMPKRDPSEHVNLIIIKDPAGYRFIAQNGGVKRATVNLSEAQIDEMLGQARAALKDLVYKQVGGAYVYQQANTTIDPAVHADALKALARVGVTLFNNLFFSPGTSQDAQAMGNLLREVSQRGQRLYIKIVAERFIFPWTLLYDREYYGDDSETVDPHGFWGFKHIIEYAPEFTAANPVNFNPRIDVQGALQFAFLANTTIDTQLGLPIIQGQRDFVRGLQGIALTEYTTKSELIGLLRNADAATQLLYIYCHAVSNLPGEKGGVASSKLLLSDGALTLDDLRFRVPGSLPIIKAAPLVFLNACQGAELSPYLYDGLVPYLISRGARGVIGTEVDTPALFAAEFAREFFTRFVAGGVTLGELLLDLRRDYLDNKNNVMGLVYALYSSGDVIVERQG